MTINSAVVPVAGWGTRLLPASKAVPKELFPLGRKPVIQHVIEELARNGINNFVFVNSTSKKAIENHVLPDPVLNQELTKKQKTAILNELEILNKIECSFVFQSEQLGLGHAVNCAKEKIVQPFVVALGDAVIGVNGCSNIVRELSQQIDAGCEAAIAFHQVPADQVANYGIATPAQPADVNAGAAFELADLVEKPFVVEAPSNLAIAARYAFTPAIFEYLSNTKTGQGGEIQLTDAIREMIQDGKRVVGVTLPAETKRYDIGNFPSYLRAIIEFSMHDPECKPIIDEFLANS